MERRYFPGLNAEEFQHPLDRKALKNLMRMKGFDLLTKKVLEWGLERVERLRLLSSGLKVTERQCPTIHRVFIDCCEILDVEPPELFIESGGANSYTTGYTKPAVVLTTGLVNLMDEDELYFVLGHELGHVKCGHVLYMMMARHIGQIMEWIGQMTLGAGKLVGKGVELALLEWSRKAEFSADRAGLIAAQSEEAALSAFMKLMVPARRVWNEVDKGEILRQAEEFDEVSRSDLLMRFYRVYYGLGMTHPWIVLRAREAVSWAYSPQYKSILSRGVSREEAERAREKRAAGPACPWCGSPIRPGDRFCRFCGRPLTS